MTTAALHKLTRARAALVVTQPFWGVLALNMKLIEEPGLGTMATDGEFDRLRSAIRPQSQRPRVARRDCP